MKKHLLLFVFVFIGITSSAQNSIPNGDFEIWDSDTYDYPQNFPFTSNPESFFRYKVPFTEVRTTDAYHGTYGVQLSTIASIGDTVGGYFVNSPNTDGDIWHGGVPYTEIPTGVRGYYKYNLATEDSGLVVVTFSKEAVNLGTYFYKIGGIHSSYNLFDFTFDPPLLQAPDSVLFGATSSDFLSEKYIPGGILKIDSVSFTGVTSQPDLLNGDFELWDSETLFIPESWYSSERGLSRTTEAYDGNYAVELTTFLANDENSISIAREGSTSTGYWSNSCNCMMGGHPFTNSIDTLVFYYKYAPTIGTDRAIINLTFKNNFANIGWAGAELPPSPNYSYFSLPFDIGSVPDSVIIDIRSSNYGNNAASYAGAVLIIDEIFFKSQLLTTGTEDNLNNNNFSVFPNPTSGIFTIEMAENNTQLDNRKIELYNVMGQRVLESEIKSSKTDFDISDSPDGIYFVKVYNGQLVNTAKIVKH